MYRQAQYDALSGRVNIRVPGERRGEDIWIGENAQVHPTTCFEGCAVVGEDAVVVRDVVMSGHVTLGGGCWVRPRATIKRSILLPGSSVGDGAYVEDCIVGYGLTCGRAKPSGAARLPADPPVSPRCLKPQHEKNGFLSSADGS